MTGAKRWMLVIGSLIAGVAAGYFMVSRPANSPDSASPAEGTSLGSALTKSGGRQNANEIAQFLADGEDPLGETAAWERIIALQPSELIAMLRDLEGRESLSNAEAKLLQLGLERWISLDTVAALAWIESSRSGRVAENYQSAFSAFAEHDLEAALARLEEGKVPQKFRAEAMRGLMKPFAAADPQRAAHFFDAFDRFSPLRRAGLNDAMASWAASDPAAALEYCRESSSRTGHIRQVLKVWGEADAAAAKAWIASLDGIDPAERDSYTLTVSKELVKDDPLGALAMFEDYQSGARRNAKVGAVLESWGKTDPAAAVEWARSLEDPAARSSAIKKLASVLGASEPELALELAESLPSADFRNQAFASYVETRANEDARGALDWAETVEDPDRRRTAVTTSIAALAYRDLLGATRYAIDASDPAHKKEMVTRIFERIGESWGYFEPEIHAELRTLSTELAPADEKLAVEAMLAANDGEMLQLPQTMTDELKNSAELDVLINWVEKEMGWGGDHEPESEPPSR